MNHTCIGYFSKYLIGAVKMKIIYRKIVFITVLLLFCFLFNYACSGTEPTMAVDINDVTVSEGEEPISTELDKSSFNIPEVYDYLIPVTSIKNQSRTGTCWCYCSLSLFESECIRKGSADNTLDLSESFIVYYTYLEKAKAYLKTMGDISFSEGGEDYDTLLVARKYGLVRESDYLADNKTYHAPVANEIYNLIWDVVDEYEDSPFIPDDVKDETLNKVKEMLNNYLGETPKKINVNGKEITPIEYAENVLKINIDDYVTITSFLEYPLYEYIELELRDNWQHFDTYINVSLGDMVEITKNSLRMGYSISCGADVTEPLAKFNKGYFIVEDNERFIDTRLIEKIRQEEFLSGGTSDDHGMLMMGLDEDEQETYDWFYLKNSWGPNWIYDGFMNMSEYYFKLKVLAITVNKETLKNFEYIFPESEK